MIVVAVTFQVRMIGIRKGPSSMLEILVFLFRINSYEGTLDKLMASFYWRLC